MNSRNVLAWIGHWHDAGAFADCSSEQVLERYVSTRDEAAFRELLHRHAGHVWTICRWELPDGGLAEDAFQATMLALVRHAGRIRLAGSLSAWLDKTARREVTVIRRKRGYQAKVEAAKSTPVTVEAGPESRIDSAVLRGAVADLPERYRLPIIYRYLAGMSPTDMARVVGIPEATGKTRLKRGLELLRKKLAAQGLGIGVGAVSVEATLSAAAVPVPQTLLVVTVKAVQALPVKRSVLAALTAWMTTRRVVVGGIVLAGGVATALVSTPGPRNGPISTTVTITPVRDPAMRGSPLLVLAAALGLAQPAPAQTGPVVVALSGTAAPAGGNYNTFSSPVLNGTGQVAFQAGLTGGSSASGVFVGAPGAIQAVALQGTAAPAGGNYNNFFSPVLNGSGQVTFNADLTGGTATRGIFVGPPGAIQAAALQGTSAPAGGNYNNTFTLIPLLNVSGQVAFFAGLTGGSSTTGVFVGAPGAVQAAALVNTAAPAGGNYSSFNVSPALNSSGQVAFTANLSGGSSTSGVFVGAPGAILAAALQGQGAPAGGTYGGFSFPRMSASGQLAFSASLTGGSSTGGVFAGAPGAIQAVALQGTAAPAGGNYSDSISSPVLNGSGQVAFRADLTGGSSAEGVFVGASGAVQAAALSGTVAPAGGNFNNFNVIPSLNASGQVAFIATLSGAGVTIANDQGLYAGSVGGLVKIVREGDQVDVDPGPGVVLRTIADGGINVATATGGQDGRGVWFSDTGVLTYRLAFTDGTSGVFTSVVPVPEPAGVLAVASLVGASAVFFLRRWTGGL